MPQKVILRVFIKGKRRPLFECEIVDHAEDTINDFVKKLNDSSTTVICFGQVCFARSEFRYYEVIHK